MSMRSARAVLQDALPEADELLEDFSEEVSPDLESTRSNMLAYKRTGGSEVQFRRDQMEVNEQLADEIRKLRRALSKAIAAINHKASKAELVQLTIDAEIQRRERLELLRNWSLLALAVGTFVFTLYKGLH